MEANRKTSFIIVCGVFVLIVFAYVATINILPDSTRSDAYYAKIDNKMITNVESIKIDNGILIIKTSGNNNAQYCVKTTKSTPLAKSICWKKIENNIATMSVFQGKRYYIWIKDSNDRISSPKSVESQLVM